MKKNTVHTIDVKGKRLGRVASEAASRLMGKDTPSFRRRLTPDVTVELVNASKLSVPLKKQNSKEYMHHTGHPGGLKKQSAKKIIDKKGHKELIRKAIYGMLPSNRLRKQMMKLLIIKDGAA